MNQPARIEKPFADMTEAEQDAWLAALPPAAGIRPSDEDPDDEAADAQVLADIAADRVYPHALVSEWLSTWGKPGRRSFKEWLAARDG